eukprot:TRINITY_DN11430_c0_g1_i1.p1 TRINITY_DN11430_c0_g1~~TRINITY_DN11430_c0_g1_i1.p1  ORF type:complete len:439 (+),score=122.91 TRINITY_DN11430_c0_g1_i1:21-1337(+)
MEEKGSGEEDISSFVHNDTMVVHTDEENSEEEKKGNSVEEVKKEKSVPTNPSEIDLKNLVKRVRSLDEGLVQKDHHYYLMNYKNTFTGAALVDWLMRNYNVTRKETENGNTIIKQATVFPTRRDATAFAEETLRRSLKLFSSASSNPSFFDSSSYFYTFTQKRRVVILGGGFAGSKVARKLERLFDVTLIDPKAYFLCVPSLPMTVANPNHMDRIKSNHTNYLPTQTTLITGKITNVKPNKQGGGGTVYYVSTLEPKETDEPPPSSPPSSSKKSTKNKDKNKGKDKEKEEELKDGEEKIEYDYLLIGTGSRYVIPWQSKNKVKVVNSIDPSQLIHSYETMLPSADHIAVIGAGPVGIELACELLVHYPNKTISIIASQPLFLHRQCKTAHKNVLAFFQSCRSFSQDSWNFRKQFYQVKRMIRGLGDEASSTYSQTLNR